MMDFNDTFFIGDEWRSQEGIARAFVRMYGEEWRYCPRKKWIGWNGSQWEPDQVMYVEEQIRLICRRAAQKATQPWVRAALDSWRTMNGVEEILRVELSQALNRPVCMSCARKHLCTIGRSVAFRYPSLGRISAC